MKSYNPLDIVNIAESLVHELLRRECGPLPPIEKFEGAGIYALYYSGDYRLYGTLVKANRDGCDYPIYVGKAAPEGARKGLVSLDTPPGPVLWSRLREHAESIDHVGLPREHFRCRFLITDEIWLSLGEKLLIQRYRPLWNTVIDGFGNHDPGGGRRATSGRPEWDTLHPGRTWAADMKPSQRSLNEIRQSVRQHLSHLTLPKP